MNGNFQQTQQSANQQNLSKPTVNQQNPLNQSQISQASQQGGQQPIQRPKQMSNIPPPYEKFEMADDQKKKQIYNTMIEQIKQYSRTNEEFLKLSQTLPQIQEDMQKLQRENNMLKQENQNLKEMPDLFRKIEEDQKSGINTDSQAQLLYQKFAQEKENLMQKSKMEKEILEKKNETLQKTLTQQNQLILTLQEKIKKLEIGSLASQDQPTKIINNKLDNEKITILEKQIHEMKNQIVMQQENLTKLNNHIRDLEDQKRMNQQQLENQREQIQQQLTQILQLQMKPNEIKVNQTEWNEINELKKQFEKEVYIMRDEIFQLKQETINAEQEKNQMQKTLLQNVEQVNKKNQQVSSLEQQLQDVIAKFKDLTQQLKIARQKAREYELSMEDIVSENSRLLLDAVNFKR